MASKLMDKPEAIIFDMDGVLIDSEPWWLVAMDECFRAHGVSLTPEDFRRTTGLRLDEVVEYWWSHETFENIDESNLVDMIYKKVFELVTTKSGPIDGVIGLLHSLKNTEIPLGVASSSSSWLITNLLGHFDMLHYFDIVQSADEFKNGKPHPEVFIVCAKKLGVTNHARCIVIEDSINGIIAAKAAKMKCIALPDPSKLEKPQFSLADKIIFQFGKLKDNWWREILN